jgi:hypothetical protein
MQIIVCLFMGGQVLNGNWIGEADKYSENDPVPCSIDDLSVTEIRDELKKIGLTKRD